MKKETQILQNETPDQRVQSLEAMAYSYGAKTYPKRLTQEDLSLRKDILSQQQIEISQLEEEKKQLVSDMNEKIKKIKNDRNITLDSIRTGVEEVYETVYNIIDENNLMMLTYNNKGELISSRPTTSDERQLSIVPDQKKSSNS